MCGKKCGQRSKGDTCWLIEEVKEAVSRKKTSYKAMCQNCAEENKRRHDSMKNKATKSVSKAKREKAEEAITELQNCTNGMFRLVNG